MDRVLAVVEQVVVLDECGDPDSGKLSGQDE